MIVKNTQWTEALETRNWTKHEIYSYNGYALFKEVPSLYDGITGSLEKEAACGRGIEAHGGIDLVHLDEHGSLCSFIASHEWDRDNPGRTDRFMDQGADRRDGDQRKETNPRASNPAS
jgi:hypothetical protein